MNQLDKSRIIYLEAHKQFCEFNSKMQKAEFQAQKFLLYGCYIGAFILLGFYIFSEPSIIIVTIAGFLFVAGTIPLKLVRFLSALDKKRFLEAEKNFQRDGQLLTAKVIADVLGPALEFTHQGKTYRFYSKRHGPKVRQFNVNPKIEGDPAPGQDWDTRWFDRPSDYVSIAIVRKEDVSLLFNPRTEEVFLLGTPTLNISEQIKLSNQK